jgi:hypothetical protein
MRFVAALLVVVGASCADVDPCAQQLCNTRPPPAPPIPGVEVGEGEGEGEGEDVPPPPDETGCPEGQSERALFHDSDGDGFTTTSVVMCAGATPPVGFASTRNPAPILIAGITANANDWNNPEDATTPDEQYASITLDDNGTPSEPLVVTGIACPALTTGTARVHLRMSADNDFTATMNVVFGAAATTTNVALTDVDSDITVELAITECSDSLSIALTSDGNFNDDVYIDAVRISVPGGDDCDDNDDTRALGVAAVVDADGDGALALGFACATDPFAPVSAPTGTATDCDDGNAQCVEDCSASACL